MQTRTPQASIRTTAAALAFAALAFSSAASAAGKHHRLRATPETVQWGWLDPKEPPKLTIASGDTVSIETWMHAKDQFQPGISMEKILELRKSNPGGAFHSLTGPIFVEGAEPGDTLKVHIDIIRLNRDWGWAEPCRTSERWRPSSKR